MKRPSYSPVNISINMYYLPKVIKAIKTKRQSQPYQLILNSNLSKTICFKPSFQQYNKSLPKSKAKITMSMLSDYLLSQIFSYLKIEQLVPLILLTSNKSKIGKILRQIFQIKLCSQSNSTILSTIILNFTQQTQLQKYHTQQINSINSTILKLDSQRTFIKKQNQQILTNTLKRFCKQSKIKYLQGMNEIAAHILTSISLTQANKVMNHIYTKMNYQNLISNDFELLNKINKQISITVSKQIPNLSLILQQNNLTTEIFTTKWILTLFTGIFVGSQLNRIWILFMIYGFQYLPLICIEIFRRISKNKSISSFQQIKHLINSIRISPLLQETIIKKIIQFQIKSKILKSDNGRVKDKISLKLVKR